MVAGAGLLVDPDHPQELADAMVRVADDVTLREHLASAGRARAAELSWDEAARRFLHLFAQVGGYATRSNTA